MGISTGVRVGVIAIAGAVRDFGMNLEPSAYISTVSCMSASTNEIGN